MGFRCTAGLNVELDAKGAERSLIAEGTGAGRVAKSRGVKFGPKHALTPSQTTHARELLEAGRPVSEISKIFGLHRATVYRALSRR